MPTQRHICIKKLLQTRDVEDTSHDEWGEALISRGLMHPCMFHELRPCIVHHRPHWLQVSQGALVGVLATQLGLSPLKNVYVRDVIVVLSCYREYLGR